MADYVMKKLHEIPDLLGDYPGEMRMATYEMGNEQVAFTHRRMPPDTSVGRFWHRMHLGARVRRFSRRKRGNR